MIHARDYVDTVEGPQPDHHPKKKWVVRVMEGKTALSKVVYAEAAILRSDGTLAFGPLVLKQSKARLDVFIKTVPEPIHFFNMATVTEWYEDETHAPAPPPAPAPPTAKEKYLGADQASFALQADCMYGDLQEMINSPLSTREQANRLVRMGWRR